MKIISHRGNLSGPMLELENSPEYIDEAILSGFDVEIDVWFNGDIYLGHDGPEYKISKEWLSQRGHYLWIHCKNLAAATHLSKDFKCFCSEVDPFCFMSEKYIWVNDISVKPLHNCVVPLLGVEDIQNYKYKDYVFAVCTDYPRELL